MGITIVFVSSVGGTGKTTLCACVSQYLCKMGKSVLLIETDPFRPLGILLKKGEEAVYDLNDLLVGNCEVEDAIVSVDDGFDMIIGPSVSLTENFAENLGTLIETLKEKYDFIIVDRPSGCDLKLETHLSNFLALVVYKNGDPLSLLAAEKIGEYLKNIGNCERRLIINHFTYKKNKKSITNLDEISDKTGLRILGVIPDDEDVSTARRLGEIPQKGKFVDACIRIGERLLNQPTPLPNLKKM